MKIRNIACNIFALIFFCGFFAYCADGNQRGAEPLDDPLEDIPAIGDVVEGKGTLVWSDEFDGDTLDTGKWNYDYGNGSQYGQAGWGNNEKEWYMEGNVSVADGKLVIEARYDTSGSQAGGVNFPYSSGKISTKGTKNHTGSRTYPAKQFLGVSTGYAEARIKAPRGRGFWPAFWMLGADVDGLSGYTGVGWPRSGEIDIFEMNGANMTQHGQAIHYATAGGRSSKGSGRYAVPNMADEFHVYGVAWNNSRLQFYFDGEAKGGPINFPLPEAGAVSAAFYNEVPWVIIINLAIGGNYVGGAEPAPSVFTSGPLADRCLTVDWVRVYEQ